MDPEVVVEEEADAEPEPEPEPEVVVWEAPLVGVVTVTMVPLGGGADPVMCPIVVGAGEADAEAEGKETGRMESLPGVVSGAVG